MLTEEIISPYIGDKGAKHQFYEESVQIANAIGVHSRGLVPDHLFKIARPNEDDKYLLYRIARYKPVTKTFFSKAVNTIKKINRAEDWKIKFTEETDFQKYMVNNYPFFESLENWFWSIAFNQMCDDANSVFATFPLPKENPEDDSEQYKPFTHIFPSENVIFFKENKLCVLLAEEKSLVTNRGQNEMTGNIYYCIDRDSLVVVTQTGEKSDNRYMYDDPIAHTCKKMPAFKAGGIIEKFSTGESLYDSFLGDAIPFWDEAVNCYSDHQVNMAIHLHPREWEMMDTPCRAVNCKNGRVEDTIDGQLHKYNCPKCQGTGLQSTKSPFDVKYIKPAFTAGAGDTTSMPTPPMGIVERDIASIGFLKQEFIDNIRYGFSALNMDFLMKEPEVNSGIAKSLDRQEVNTYFFTIARHIVNNILNPLYRFHACWMYPNDTDEKIYSMLPSIPVPDRFDIISSELISARLVDAKNAELGSTIRTSLEIEYAEREFGEESDESLIIKISNMLDPHPNKTEDEKMAILSSEGTTKERYILSCCLPSFINRALNEVENFFKLDYKSQIAIMNGYVQEIMDKQKTEIIPQINLNPNPAVNAA